MKLLYSQIQNFLLNKNHQFDRVNQALIELGIEVDALIHYDYENIFAVKIENISPHPNADRLQIALVNDGKNKYKIVCGAKNIQVGQIVPLAKANTRLGEIFITKSTIRGVESNGMLCSEVELGLGDDHSGILILKPETKIGTKLSQIYPNPTIFDLSITPNRPDFYSALGIARELNAFLDQKTTDFKSENLINWQKNDFNIKNLAHSYYLIELQNIKNFETPKEIIFELKTLGINPKNNLLVDLTNWANIVYGQPLHAFDKEKISGEINIRQAKKGEKLILLNKQKIALDEKDIVIADKDKSVALAGIMGGLETSVHEQTKTIILEGASFNQDLIRATVVRSGINSDASVRFEKGVDPNLPSYVLEKIYKIIKKTNPELKIIQAQYQNNFTLKTAFYQSNFCQKLSGINIDEKKQFEILQTQGFKKINKEQFEIPSWRFDIEGSSLRQCEIVEDIVRFYVIDKLPEKSISKKQKQINCLEAKFALSAYLAMQGFNEIISTSFCSPKEIELLNAKDKCPKIYNPRTIETAYLRPTLLMGALKTVLHNHAFKTHIIFEIGTVFDKSLKEYEKLICLCTKNQKNILEKICHDLNIDPDNIQSLDEKIVKELKIRGQALYYFEVDLKNIKLAKKFKIELKNIKYKSFSNFSPSVRDFSLWINDKINQNDLLEELKQSDQHILLAEIFDQFKSKEGKTSIAIRFVIDPIEKSFTEKDIDVILNKITKLITKKGLIIR